jgi:glycosyltransferase involved in cell wall biosynthesis
VDRYAQRLKATMATLVALHRVVPVSMSAKDIDEAFEVLERLGYTVSYIACGECDEDDLLVELHSCHLEKLNVLFDDDGLDPTTDLI